MDKTRISARSSRCLALFAALLFVTALAIPVGGQDQDRVQRLGKQLFCICGCNQILTECNHVGCYYSHTMLKKLSDRVQRGESDELILQDFVQEYGPTVLTSPPARGFNLWAWIMPLVAPLIGIVLVWIVVRRWRRRMAQAGTPKVSPELLARARSGSGGDLDEQ